MVWVRVRVRVVAVLWLQCGSHTSTEWLGGKGPQ